MFQSSAAIVIHRPIGEVFRFATDLSIIPLWVSGAQVRSLSTGPFGEGTQFEESLMRFGRAFTSIVEVKNYQVNDGFDFQTINAPFPIVSAIGGLHFAGQIKWSEKCLEPVHSLSQPGSDLALDQLNDHFVSLF